MAKINYSEIKVAAARTALFNNIRNVIEIVNIHDVIKLSSGINLPSHKMIDGEYPVFGGGGSTSFTHEAYNVDFETLAIGRVGARCGCVFKVPKKSWVTDNALYALSLDNRFDLDYVINYLSYVDLNQFANRAAQPVISLKRISTINFPLVELSLQKKIVEIIIQVEKGETNFDDDSFGLDKSLKSVDSIRLLQNELTSQLTQLENLNQAILQEAVQGKLVAQDAADEPASKLLKRIKAEKAASGKKEKPLPAIKAEEIPFEIPENWVWCRLGDLTLYSEAGKSYNAEGQSAKLNEWGVIKTSAITTGIFEDVENKRLPNQNVELEKIRIHIGDIIFCRASGSKGLAGKSCIVHQEPKSKLILSDKSIRFVFMNDIYQIYIQLYNTTFFAVEYYSKLGTGKSTSMNNIVREDFNKMPIPLPPLSEQKRIVAEIEKQLEKTKQLKAHIIANQLATEQLLKALLHGAFEVEEK
ncbi:MAG: restriction endonuclease subunit S [Saprospiraceae bacterium]